MLGQNYFWANSFATAIFLAKGAFNNYVDKKGLSWAQISQERKKLSKKITLAKYLIFEVFIRLNNENFKKIGNIDPNAMYKTPSFKSIPQKLEDALI